ncbi:serine/threonine-protein kinase RIO3 [Neodiprion pinetum]|uniref:Serine/threonine-protein kinase RIO3 isoform X1 n=2 Tax=Neodiprion lecontei TaxID=441921 RepID=A0A6J0BP70_NEOLC|nr:serine/threonine-protein kinase RIO3 isoform X1 [Neodiprion lecontei]XP_046488332.1 serine/threonine-protein kinase RIO3-like isoform X1 [Neodiprion pinetum]XP_046488342.1 serine/threonine-protein kinase RIO3-like isoform X1 [Neodiprion pinetum]XP_046488351.1 serine/threonine-protein kinase RIO3-like isoform X1 [Neodiprion pinetum]XP_046596719.1 serine/threonine-protein kinase RIO3 isoform X1 [Neodiprion lecontei]XP_046596725.1 serine/threonine-protein kinase RIO3 isoform X1 [Neodiprion lec
MSSPWGKIQPPATAVSLTEIMSEEVAKDLQEKEIRKHADLVMPEPTPEECGLLELDDTDSDAVIAQTLQAQFNREYDSMLKRTEDKFNGFSKVNVSYSNYRTCPSVEPDERKPEVDEENRDWDRFVSVEKEYASIPRCGYKRVGEGSEIITKHDMLMSSRINACRVLAFPPGIKTGDAGSFDMKLNNKVFNSLRAHSHAHCAREKAKARPNPKQTVDKIPLPVSQD